MSKFYYVKCTGCVGFPKEVYSSVSLKMLIYSSSGIEIWKHDHLPYYKPFADYMACG